MSSTRLSHATVAFVLLLLLVVLVITDQTRIVSSPQSVNVSSGDQAVFNCTAIANFIEWEINGGTLNADQGFEELPIINLNVSQNLRQSTLRAEGSSASNNDSIVCVALLEVAPFMFAANRSEPALLLVQGLLESISDLTVEPINSTTVLISWSPPFTLEGVPILGYTVTITNVTSGENETILERENTTALYYIFTIDDPDPDSNFTVTVVPINVVGAGQVSIDFNFSVKEVIVSSSESAPFITPTPVTSITTSDNFVGTVMPTMAIGGLPTGAIIGIVLAAVVVAAAAVVVVVIIVVIIKRYCCKKKVPSQAVFTEMTIPQTTTVPTAPPRNVEADPTAPPRNVEADDDAGVPRDHVSPSKKGLPLSFLKVTTSGPKGFPNKVFVWQKDHVPYKRRCSSLVNIVVHGQMDEQEIPLLDENTG